MGNRTELKAESGVNRKRAEQLMYGKNEVLQQNHKLFKLNFYYTTLFSILNLYKNSFHVQLFLEL